MALAAADIVNVEACVHHFLIPEANDTGTATGTCVFCNTKREFNTRFTDPTWDQQQAKFGRGRIDG